MIEELSKTMCIQLTQRNLDQINSIQKYYQMKFDIKFSKSAIIRMAITSYHEKLTN